MNNDKLRHRRKDTERAINCSEVIDLETGHGLVANGKEVDQENQPFCLANIGEGNQSFNDMKNGGAA